MKRLFFTSASALFLTAVLIPAAARAAVTIDIIEVGPDLLATTSGSLDLTGLTFDFPVGNTPGIASFDAFVATGGPGTNVEYEGFTGPSTWGSGNFAPASSSSGTYFSVDGSLLALDVPTGYVSGSPISSTATWLGQSFASLGLIPGTYVYATPNDTITVNVGLRVAAVPEPATWAMMLVGFFGMALAIRRGRRRHLVSA